jgi:hypothetical protein
VREADMAQTLVAALNKLELVARCADPFEVLTS